ncbi:conserved hypothetical protein; putative EDD domain [metagenome]|uniref:DegV family protein n=1 Tax=metagenome TaxID=256318 RepID=A0A2P2BWU1_9ZZZZ
MPRITVVTDSTASLPDETARARGVLVVPLQVVIGAASYDEGSAEATPAKVAEALRTWTPVSTSRPTPAAMLQTYRAAAAAGAEGIVSVHLSSEMSGTLESAQLAARDSPVPVVVVDSRQVGFATGVAALEAADVIEAGGSAEEAADAARRRATGSTSLFYVDTLEYLRRGGRIGAAAAILGSALAVKPLLQIEDGRIASLEKVRTTTKALARLVELAVEAAGDSQVSIGVAHLANPERADALVAAVSQRLAANLDGRPVQCAELGAVLGAHVGPGMVAVCVSPLL